MGKMGKVEVRDYQDFLSLLMELEEEQRERDDVPPAKAQRLGGDSSELKSDREFPIVGHLDQSFTTLLSGEGI
jgi:hypothetical protein